MWQAEAEWCKKGSEKVKEGCELGREEVQPQTLLCPDMPWSVRLGLARGRGQSCSRQLWVLLYFLFQSRTKWRQLENARAVGMGTR